MSFKRPPEIERIRNEFRNSDPALQDPFVIENCGDDDILPLPAILAPAAGEGPDDEEFDPEPAEVPVRSPFFAPRHDPSEPFIIHDGETWLQSAATAPAVQTLFDRFWYQGELCILFADTNAGKSVLAVQIGDSISRGAAIGDFEPPPGPARVLYFDFELTDRQFHRRYSSEGQDNYAFSKNFFRAVMNPDCDRARRFDSYELYIINALENALLVNTPAVLIIDNITCLRYSTHATSGALSLMRSLQQIKSRYQLSILVLAHTPKRNPVKPLGQNDLQGSKMLINFADSAFAIGESQALPGVRYLKQVKQRSTREYYGAENVCLCSMVKPGNFLHFSFTTRATEANHLMHYSRQQRQHAETHIAELSSEGLSIRQIAARLDIAVATVHRALKGTGLTTSTTPPATPDDSAKPSQSDQ